MEYFSRVLAHVAATPWAIEPAKGSEIASILSRRLGDREAKAGEVEAWKEIVREAKAAREERQRQRHRGTDVALIPVYGVLTHRADMFTEVSGLASAEDLGRQVDAAAADKSVRAIVLDIDSPGGSVFGTPELGAKIAAATESKKVTAVVNATAASGAYWLASQASEIVVTPSGMVGSIGVYLMHVDRGKEMEARGRTVTFVAEGERKTAGHEYGPLSEAGQAEMREIVSGYYEQFLKAVAKGRKSTVSAVRGGFGRGGMVLAQPAIAEGMADRIGTLDDVLSRHGVTISDVVPAAEAPATTPALALRRRRMQVG